MFFRRHPPRPLRIGYLMAMTLLLPAASAWGTAAADSGRIPHGSLLRYPDVSATQVVFSYGNDLWLVPREGGVASPLASPPGQELFPRFSPDGETIAFVGNYDGDQDLYTVPAAGGVPRRITHHPTSEQLCDWTPDGRLLFQAGQMNRFWQTPSLYTVAATGGLPRLLPVPYGAAGAVSPDGHWLAYTPMNRDFRTWKRYRGGLASDIWLFALGPDGGAAQPPEARRVTDWEGTDTQPMWHGSTLYYLSDAGPEHRLNIWSYDPASGEHRQLTHFADYDAKWPAIGPGPAGGGEIVMQYGATLQLLDLATAALRQVEVTIPGARPHLRPRPVDVADLIAGAAPSPSGQRVVVEARGDVWTLPAEDGSPRNLTRSSGAAEREPAWSPDGRWIAYFADLSGEYQIYLRDASGKGESRQLSQLAGTGFLSGLRWSPDSKFLAFWASTNELYIQPVAGGAATRVDENPWALMGDPAVGWSPDGHWLAYSRGGKRSWNQALWLYHLDDGRRYQVTSGYFTDMQPTFDRAGDFLYFVSSRGFSDPTVDDVGTAFAYADTQELFAVPLRADVAWPLAARSDEEPEVPPQAKAKGGKAEEKAASDKPVPPLAIDLEGFERRATLLPVAKGLFSALAVDAEDRLLYRRSASGRDDGDVQLFDFEEEAEATVIEDVDGVSLSADGKKLLIAQGEQLALIDVKPDAKVEAPLSTGGMIAVIDPRQEWQQLFDDAWRLYRDFFYDPGMHGVDWPAVRRSYQAMLDDCTSREDVGYVISEMISELNVGHAYYSGGDYEPQPQLSTGLLGADYELQDGAYRIAKIYHGADWDTDARGPLGQPGVDVRVGDYLLAVNGVPVDPAADPWVAFQGLGGRVVNLTVSRQPQLDDAAREVVVELLANDGQLRYWDWIEANRAYVEARTGGRVGYVYVPNTGDQGRDHLVRQLYGQLDKEALIIDDRWNGGGQLPSRFVELLNRPVNYYLTTRHGADIAWPFDAQHGPKCMLTNGRSASGGDSFPYMFREAGLGKLVGTRTWGGVVGLVGGPQLIDGAVTTVPSFAVYEQDGTWAIEGHGVDPDLEVIDDPAKMVDGGDPQLDAAIQLMLDELEAHPHRWPQRPAYPNRSGMGLPAADH